MQLSYKDYGKSDRSKSQKKGRYGVTVPKPFSFDIRENTKPKSIAEKKLERDMAEKKIEEEAMIQH
jgi:hypothetical protein